MCGSSKSRITPSRRQRECGAVPGDLSQSAKKQKDRIQRADVFNVAANPGKVEAVRALWPDWRRGLRAEAMVARRDLMAGRQIRDRLLAADEAEHPGIAASKAAIGSAAQQMVRAQAMGTVTGFLGNCKNGVSDAIHAQFNPRKWGGRAKRRFEALPEDTRRAIEADLATLRHEMSAINVQRLWMAPEDMVVMRKLDDDRLVPVSSRARRIARAIFLGVVAERKWPRFRRMSMRMDYRAGPTHTWLDPSETSTFSWWLTLKTANDRVALPILGWGRDGVERKQGALRDGVLGKTVNLVGDDGSLRVVLNRDMTDVFAASREAYQPLLDLLALDYGLNSLFATSEGDLLGRGFKKKLLPLTDRADEIARREQKAGRKPRDCVAYRRIIERIRGLIQTEVNRALNQAVMLHRPRVIAVEKLDFRGMGMSRRLNRILSNCGRGAVEKKLNDLAQRYGIEIHEIDPAYTSQTCSCCGYVDKRQRQGEKFQCRHCGTRMHADVNGARNIAQAVAGQASEAVVETPEGRSRRTTKATDVPRRRKRKASTLSRTRSASLRVLVRRFDERMSDLTAVSRPRRGSSGTRESAPDPRLTNSYWKQHSLLLKGKSPQGRNRNAAACAVDT